MSRKDLWLFSSLIITLLLVSSFALIPAWRESLRSFLRTEQRSILGSLQSSLFDSSQIYKIVKIKSSDKIYLEIYKLSAESLLERVQKISLDGKNDAYFSLSGQSTNLALADLNNDSVPEILAPTFDENMAARLSIFHFNQETKLFERMAPQVIPAQ